VRRRSLLIASTVCPAGLDRQPRGEARTGRLPRSWSASAHPQLVQQWEHRRSRTVGNRHRDAQRRSSTDARSLRIAWPAVHHPPGDHTRADPPRRSVDRSPSGSTPPPAARSPAVLDEATRHERRSHLADPSSDLKSATGPRCVWCLAAAVAGQLHVGSEQRLEPGEIALLGGLKEPLRELVALLARSLEPRRRCST
jgi:hypothetical protein